MHIYSKIISSPFFFTVESVLMYLLVKSSPMYFLLKLFLMQFYDEIFYNASILPIQEVKEFLTSKDKNWYERGIKELEEASTST